MAEKKQHKPTPKKLEKARKEGQVLKGPILARAFSMIAVFMCIIIYLPHYWVRSRMLLEYCFNSAETSMAACMQQGGELALFSVVMVLGIAAIFGVMVELFQVGWKPQPQLLLPKLSRIDPVQGSRRLFQGVKDVAFRLPFVVALIVCAVFFLQQEVQSTVLYTMSGSLKFGTGLRNAAVLVVAVVFAYALVEFTLKRRRFFIDQSMSTQDLRDEFKDSDGDPLMKSMRQAMHEELAMQEVVARVKKSRVILVEKV